MAGALSEQQVGVAGAAILEVVAPLCVVQLDLHRLFVVGVILEALPLMVLPSALKGGEVSVSGTLMLVDTGLLLLIVLQ